MRSSVRLLVVLSLVFAACPPVPATETLELSPATLALETGEVRVVTAQARTGTTPASAAGTTWTSSDPAIAQVSTTGDGTAAIQGIAPGTATVSAKLREATATVSVTVSARVVTLTRIELTPATASLAKGTTLQLTATGVFSDGTNADLTATATWTSADAAVLTVAGGLVTGLAPGTAQVTAAKDGLSGTLSVTVTPATLEAIDVTPALPTLAKGTTQQLTATARFSDSTTQDVTSQVTWTSAATAAATVDAAGLVTAVDTGSAVVTAELNGVSGSTTITVTAAVLTAIDLTPTMPTVPRGLTEQLTATGRFSDGTTQDVTSQATWASAAPAVATVSNAGLVTAVTLGTSSVSATVGSVIGSTTVTVSSAQLISLAVTPATPSLARGLTRTFTATGTFSDTSTQDVSASVTWSSSAPGVASISNATGSEGLATAQAVGTTTITATSGTIMGSTVLTVTAATVTSLQVTPTTPTLPRGLTQQFTATGIFSDGTMQNLTTSVTWTTGTASVATISNAAGSEGLLTAVAVGSSTVVATLGAVTNGTTLTVTAARLDRIDVTPVAPSVARGRTSQLTATGVYSDASTQDLTATVTWSSTASTVASVSNAAGSEGLLTAANVGTTTVTATLGTVSGSQLVTVTAAVLTSLNVTPAGTSLALGRTRQFTATGTYSDTTTQDLTTQVTWSTGTPATATVSNAAGSEGLGSALAVGNTTVIATLGTVTGNTTLTVTAAELVSIAVTGAPATLPRGRTADLTATGTYSDASTQNLTTQVTWTSSPVTFATVSNGAGTEGRVTAVAVGTATVTATLGTISGNATLDVTAAVLESIAVTPAAQSTAKGRTQQYTAIGTYSDTTTQNLTTSVTWGSSAPAFLTVSNAGGSEGLATAIDLGTGNVTAQSGTVTGSTTFTVTAAVLVSIAVMPDNPSVAKGLTQQLTATGTFSDASTQNLTTTVTWGSGTPAIATISNAAGSEGLATAADVGTSLITATSGAIVGSTTLAVTPAALVSIAVTPAAPTLSAGGTQQFVATGTYSDASTQVLTTSVTWASTATAFLTVSNAAGSEGLATAVAVGTSTVSATSGAVSGSTLVTVSNATLVSIAVTPASPSVAKGRTQQFIATGTYSDTTTQDLTTQATWASADPAAATIVPTTGLATAVAVGTSSISATFGAISGATTLTVGPAVLESIAVTPTNPSVARGLTQQLVATGTFSDASTQDVTATVTWASSDTNIATIGAGTGLASAANVGITTVSATSGTVSGNTLLAVVPALLVSIAVTPTAPTINAGATVQLVATGTYTDSSTQNITATVTWVSQSPAFATVNAAGLVTGTGGGSSQLDATLGAITGSTTVTVVAPPPVVLSTVPLAAAIGVNSLAPVSFTFDRPMNPVTLTVQSSSGSCSGSLQVSRNDFASCIGLNAPVMSGGNTVATLTPVPALAYGSTYKLRATTSAVSSFGTPMAATFTLATEFTTAVDGRCATGLVISQVYAGGGNSGAQYTNDFIELHNPTSAAIDLTGFGIQFVSATGAGTWAVQALPAVSIPAGGYFLIQEAAGAGTPAPLPTPDYVGAPTPFAIGASSGKVALTNNTTALSGACPVSAAIVDLVGFGTTANCFEGAAPAPAPSNTTSVQRKKSGCTDENSNALDYAVAAPLPRGTLALTPPLVCACSANETGTAGELDFCNLQHPPSTTTAAATLTENIFGRVFEDTVTQPAGANAMVRAEVGYGPVTANPQNQAGWQWFPASFNTQIGNDDEYQRQLTAPVGGTYRYTTRFSLDGVYWTYCDLNGAGGNAGLDFDPAQLGVLTVTP
ncbi:MAG: Ig-like domain-containing protein [Archangium sp.]|nr:Ig-like domain-containing protein [Archangium sp.]